MTTTKTIAIAACAAVLAGAGGVALSQSGSDAAATPSTSAPTQMGQPGGGTTTQGRPDLSALAEDLGVTESKLQAAMEAVRPTDPSRMDPSSMAADLASELGLSTAAVQKALQANAPSGGPPMGGGAPPSGAAPATGAPQGQSQS